MDSQVLDHKKQELELDDFIQSTSDHREIKRALVVKWSLSGISYRQIIKLLNVSLGFISKWNNKFSIWGVKGLKMGYKGKQGYLSKSEKAEIILWLSQREMWDLAELAIYIESKYGVIYQSQQSYYSLFESAQISWKKSQKKNPKGDPKFVESKKKEINEYLETWQSDIKQGKLCVFMLDECHLLWGDLCGYVWGKSARRVEVEMTNQKQRQTYYGALDYGNKEFLVQPYEKGDSANTISFLKYLIKQRQNSRLTIIWDGATYHKSQELREYLELVNKGKCPEEWQINCILFAPNAPEQNPVEDIWLQGKNLLRKFAYRCKSFAIVKRLFMFFLNRQIFGFPKLYMYG